MATKKGICKNVFNCSKADSSEVIEIDEFQDFICPECKQPLEDVEGDKGPGNENGNEPGNGNDKKFPWKKFLIIVIPVVLVGGGVGAYFATSGGGEEPAAPVTPPVETPAPAPEPEVEAPAPKPEQQPAEEVKQKPASNKLNLGYATYEGDIRNGKAHGNGVMTFSRRQVVPGAKDNIEAQPGEYAVGVWRNGEVNMVTLYQKDGNQVKIMHK